VGAIERAARGADRIFLATDLDREGEAIAWHVAEAASLPPEKLARVTFSEITEPAIREAFARPREINRDLVDAQQARRIVDRLVGYTLSPLISRKVRSGLSAGRVQSVAVRLVVEREREIRAFTAREYWTIVATLLAPDGTPFRPTGAHRTAQAEIGERGHRCRARTGDPPPFVRCSAGQHEEEPPQPGPRPSRRPPAAGGQPKLGFRPLRTMGVAQRLFEGVDSPDGHVGLITYMRTDSLAMAGQALGQAREVIAARFGDAYTMPKGRVHRTKSKSAQEAHEAIRPTSFARDPEAMAAILKPEEARLYRLIWQRALASQMKEKELETTTVDLAAGPYGLRPRPPGPSSGLSPPSTRGARRRR